MFHMQTTPPTPPQPNSQSSTSSALTSNSLIIDSPRHNDVRCKATENYLRTANKKRAYDEHLYELAEQYKKGDCLGVRIHEVDRTNTDPKVLPCILVAKEKKDNDFIFHLCCQYGFLQNKFSIESIIDLISACPDELKSLNVFELHKEISLIEATKLFVRGSVSGAAYDCKSQCATRHCPCRKVNVACSTKCHSKRGKCQNTK
ncbi:unnamed protein product [Didymodactylos carnosus]|uniref:Uncharacterized protein n=1 Tax=Didymodactylos carnosus TaxID=1234261 RepID=A0A8S2D2Z0_9BILA|nr:unnamed protein product [Didymodactylos carnosus]CAF3651943.1 unnamed protein product [Didymodactylos carnosus]